MFHNAVLDDRDSVKSKKPWIYVGGCPLKHPTVSRIQPFRWENCMLVRTISFSSVWWIIGLLFSASTAAADKPNFTGKWIRNAGASDAFTAVVIPLIGPRKNSPGNNFLLRINHRNKHLQVAVEQDAHHPVSAAYDLGRGWHGNLGPRLENESGGTRYRAKWNRDALLIEKYAIYQGGYGTAQAKIEQEWVLSSGGNVLTITSTIDGFTVKEVFNREKSSP
jgi:hypothetical protein